MMGLLPRTRIFVDVPTIDEVEALVEIHGDAFARGWSVEEFEALLSGPNVFVRGVRRESVFGFRRLVGFVIVRIAADEAEILTIAILRTRRGRGYGRMLMEEAMRCLYREGAVSCFLEVNHGNDRAVSLYRALGFEEVGRRKGYYDGADGSDRSALVMRLQLR